MEKMKFTDNQVALEYAAYMMIGSYFKKAKCSHEMLEKSMRLQFMEQKKDDQYQLENACIEFAEEILLKELPLSYFDEEVIVRFIKTPQNNRELIFIGKSFVLKVIAKYRKKGSKLSFDLLKK